MKTGGGDRTHTVVKTLEKGHPPPPRQCVVYPCSCKETRPVSQLISSQSWAGGCIRCLWMPWTASPHSMRRNLSTRMKRWNLQVWLEFWLPFCVYGKLEVPKWFIGKISSFIWKMEKPGSVTYLHLSEGTIALQCVLSVYSVTLK